MSDDSEGDEMDDAADFERMLVSEANELSSQGFF
jgi:hypothetical protein